MTRSGLLEKSIRDTVEKLFGLRLEISEIVEDTGLHMNFHLYPAVQMIMEHQDPPDKEKFPTRTFNSIELGNEIRREVGTNIDYKTHILALLINSAEADNLL